ncbi:MAG: YicC family protein [Flavobacteriaceae bacterium]|nr:YicC family protein [Flavobacteriaceae bacterium]
MIESMTGFGKSEISLKEKTIFIELRSLNSKNLEINSSIPSKYKSLEPEIRKAISKNIKRGKLDLYIRVANNRSLSETSIDKNVVNQYLKELKSIVDVSESKLLPIAMRLPESFKTKKQFVNQIEKKSILVIVNRAIKDLKKFRIKEGKELFKDFRKRLKLIEKKIDLIPKIDFNRIKRIKQKLNSSLFEINLKVDRNRFEQELIYYLEKLDITEEKVRLKSHIKYFVETLNHKESQGKKLGFITQVIVREINTIGSKANDVKLQKLVVQVKNELEKIKEQLLNVL